MTINSRIIKKALLLFVMLIMLLPIIQFNLNLFRVKDLNGSFSVSPNADFTFNKWFDATYQDEDEKYLNENFGFRNTLVRIYNQFRFDLFRKTYNQEAVFGVDDYFFVNTYIKSYTGQDFIGNENILKKCLLIKELQDSLKNHDQIFLPIIAPSKVRVLSDLLPPGVIKQNRSNYEVFVQIFKKLNIQFIDFNEAFIKVNKTSKYPLYSKYGIHWNSYGQTFAADSIINYLNYKYKLNTPKMVWKNNISLSDSLQNMDYDIGNAINLYTSQLPSDKMPYPKISYTDNENKKPSTLVIGDSFNLGLEQTDFQNQVFSDYKFLYYFKKLTSSADETAIYNLNLKEEIKNHKVIMLIATEFNMVDYGWQFLEKATGLFNGKLSVNDLKYENRIHIEEIAITNNNEVFSELKNKALVENKNVDTLLFESARYNVDKVILTEPMDRNTKIKILRTDIKNNPGWMKQIEQKAKDRNITKDSMLTIDAIWLFEQQAK